MTANNSSDDRLDAQYSAFVHDLTGTLDIEAGLAEAIQPSRFTELVTDLDGLLNLGAGLSAILTAGGPNLAAPPNAKAPADRPSGAAEFLAELEEAAVHGYGADWEAGGRTELAEHAAGARPRFRLDPATLAGTSGRSGPRRSFLGRFQLGRSGRIAAAVSFALILGLALTGVVPREGLIGGVEGGFSYSGAEAPAASDLPGSSRPDLAQIEEIARLRSSTLVASAPTPLTVPPGSLMRVSAVSLSSFERRGNLTRLVVQVTTTGRDPVHLILGYGSGRGGDSGPGPLDMVFTRTLSGNTSYSVADYRSLPADCTGYSYILVTSTPAPDTSPRFAELAFGSCSVEVTPDSIPPPAVPNESLGWNESSAYPLESVME